jgi:GT2 family glycosyltransferase
VTPTFSVLIPAYNAEATIAETLDSLLAQTRGDWEAIVVDDGSTDATAEVASAYAARDPRFSVLSKANGGAASARNLAARHASGSLWCLLDADDLYLPTYFERMGRFVDEHPSYDIFSASGYFFRSGEGSWPDEFPGNDAVRSYEVDDMLVRNRFSVQSLFRRGVFDLAGGFDEDPCMFNEDYYFWLRAMLRGARHIHNPERLWTYRVSSGQKTSDPVRFMRGDIYVIDTLLSRGEIRGRQARIARKSRRRLARDCRIVEARGRREQLEDRLARGDLAGARAAYLAAGEGYASKAKYALGVTVMLASPRLFARLAPKIAAEDPTSGIETEDPRFTRGGPDERR